MTGDELAARILAGAVTVLDVRSPEEHAGADGYPCDPRQGHIPSAVNVPVDEILAAQRGGADALHDLLAGRGADVGRPLVAYCHSGQRSSFAATVLRAAGLDATNYEGSWHEWSRREEPDAQPS